MKRNLTTTYEEVMSDLGYYTRRAATFITSKAMVQSLPFFMFGFIGDNNTTLQAITTTLVGAGVMGVSAGLTQMDHNHRLVETAERYREELAKITGKAKQKIEVEDLLSVANGDAEKGVPANPTLRQVVQESALQRNIGVVLSAVAALAAFLVVGAMHTEPAATLAYAGEVLSHGFIGFLTYNAIKQPLHYGATKLLGLREETVDQAICAISHTRGKGHLVSQEQVLDVLMEAHSEVAASIQAQFGKAFEEMSAKEKIGVLQSVPKEAFNLEKVTEDINLGHIKPEELAFMAFGQRSGVESKRKDVLPTRPPVLDSMWNFLSGLTAGFIGKAEPVTAEQVRDALPQMAGTTNYRIDTPDANTASFSVHNEQETEKGKKSFAAMVGRKQSPEGTSHVERYEQRLQEQGANEMIART